MTPRFKTGNMWDAFDEADCFLITTNEQVNRNGELVMGRGIALEAKTRFPDLAKMAGDLLQTVWWRYTEEPYIILFPYSQFVDGKQKIGLFQVKIHWRDPASLELIEEGVELLTNVIEQRGYKNVHLPFPGIGNGRLRREQVLPLLDSLPECVTVWEYAPASPAPLHEELPPIEEEWEDGFLEVGGR